MNTIDIKKRVQEVLNRGHLMSLGVQDAAGVWVSDVVYASDDNFTMCWMSDPNSRHSQAILKNGHVAGTITVSNKSGEKNLGIQFSGVANKVEDNRFEIAKLYFLKRGKPIPKETDDVLKGDFWYTLKPDKMYLIDEENFGFNRQNVEI